MENFAVPMEELDLEMDELELHNITSTRDITKQELERASYILRLQNVSLEKDENLYTLQAPLVDMEPENFHKELDHIYRHNSVHSRIN